MYMTNSHCYTCNGARLKKEILCIKINGKNINEITEMSIKALKEFLSTLKLTQKEGNDSRHEF